MLVPVPVSVVSVPKVHWCSNSLGVPVPLYLVPVPFLHTMWVPVPVNVVPAPLPPQLVLFTLELPGASRRRLEFYNDEYKGYVWNTKNDGEKIERKKVRKEKDKERKIQNFLVWLFVENSKEKEKIHFSYLVII